MTSEDEETSQIVGKIKLVLISLVYQIGFICLFLCLQWKNNYNWSNDIQNSRHLWWWKISRIQQQNYNSDLFLFLQKSMNCMFESRILFFRCCCCGWCWLNLGLPQCATVSQKLWMVLIAFVVLPIRYVA